MIIIAVLLLVTPAQYKRNAYLNKRKTSIHNKSRGEFFLFHSSKISFSYLSLKTLTPSSIYQRYTDPNLIHAGRHHAITLLNPSLPSCPHLVIITFTPCLISSPSSSFPLLMFIVVLLISNLHHITAHLYYSSVLFTGIVL